MVFVVRSKNVNLRHERALEWVEKGVNYLEQGLPCPPSTWPGGCDRLPDTDETLLRSVNVCLGIEGGVQIVIFFLSQESTHDPKTGDEMPTQVTKGISL